MTQYKKDEIRERIDAAALSVFACKGYRAAKISDIAAQARVSVGNIYRYYTNKDEIFYTVVPDDVFLRLQSAITAKIGAADGGMTAGGRIFREVTDTFLGFLLAKRAQITILFSGSEGTRYAHIRVDIVDTLLTIVKRAFPEHYGRYIDRYGSDTVLRLIYENLVGAYGKLLQEDCDEKALVKQISQINLYHFSGIMRLLEI